MITKASSHSEQIIHVVFLKKLIPAIRCWSRCPADKIRVAMDGYTDGCCTRGYTLFLKVGLPGSIIVLIILRTIRLDIWTKRWLVVIFESLIVLDSNTHNLKYRNVNLPRS